MSGGEASQNGTFFSQPIVDLSKFSLLAQGAEGVSPHHLLCLSIISYALLTQERSKSSSCHLLADGKLLGNSHSSASLPMLSPAISAPSPDNRLREAQRVYDGQFLGKPAIIKQRFSKKYRHSSLDIKLTQLRFKQARSIFCFRQPMPISRRAKENPTFRENIKAVQPHIPSSLTPDYLS